MRTAIRQPDSVGEKTSRRAERVFNKPIQSVGLNPFAKGKRLSRRSMIGFTRLIGPTATACLVAIEHGINDGYNIAKLYNIQERSVYVALRNLCTGNLISEGDLRSGRQRRPYDLTELGGTVVSSMREDKDEFFLKCQRWVAPMAK